MGLKIPYTKALSKEQAYSLVRQKITPEYLKKWKVSADVSYAENAKVTASGKGFTLNLSFFDDYLELDLDLGLLLKPLKSMISTELEKQLKKTI